MPPVRTAGRAPVAVTIAGSDSSGGAGIQADMKTFSALGVYGATVIVALTAQNTRGVSAILDVPADFIAAQIDAIFSDLAPGAVKIGMLSTRAAIEAVAAGLDRHRPNDVVLDPVMAASTGARLLAAEAVEAMKRLLFPRARLVTPNLVEAAALLDIEVASDEGEMCAQAERLLGLGAQAVLIKGGHGAGPESVDLLVERTGGVRLASPRIATENTHGSGCTLSAAIAAGLAKGADLATAVGAAKDFVSRAIAAADRLAIGSGHGPVHHLHAFWRAP